MSGGSGLFAPGALSGKVALVTGASRGLGKAIALALGEAGADLALSGRSRESLEAVVRQSAGSGVQARAFTGDIREVRSVREMVGHVLESYGRIDILINCAGLNVPQAAADVTEEAWDEVLDTNTKGLFFCCQAVGREMVSQRYGRIVNVASQMSVVGYYQRAAYCASKGAVSQLTKVLAIEWATHNVTVNAIAPTFVETEMTQPMFDKDPAFLDDVMRRIPMGRLGRPEEVADAAVFLASDAASLVTGHTLLVDGGWTAW